MKQANVSVCLASASRVARDMAQILLLEESLEALPQAVRLAAHLQVQLAWSLSFWILFGITNALMTPLLSLTTLHSSLLYAGAWGVGYRQTRQLGKLKESEEPKDETVRDVTPYAAITPVA